MVVQNILVWWWLWYNIVSIYYIDFNVYWHQNLLNSLRYKSSYSFLKNAVYLQFYVLLLCLSGLCKSPNNRFKITLCHINSLLCIIFFLIFFTHLTYTVIHHLSNPSKKYISLHLQFRLPLPCNKASIYFSYQQWNMNYSIPNPFHMLYRHNHPSLYPSLKRYAAYLHHLPTRSFWTLQSVQQAHTII